MRLLAGTSFSAGLPDLPCRAQPRRIVHEPMTIKPQSFVGRLIESIRRAILGQIFFWNAVDLERKLENFRHYFTHSRAHASLDASAPAEVSGDVVTHPATLRNYIWEEHCNGLFELPLAA